MPALYIVATPIGNLEDITLRALRVLREVKLIAAEDTRKTRRLLSRYEIKTPTTSYYEHNKQSKLEYILRVLEQDDVALVSEAGTPGMSDPGFELIAASIRRGIRVVPIPGPSVVVAALTIAGLPLNRITWVGFLSHSSTARRKTLGSLAEVQGVIVMFESPHRLIALLKDVLETLGDRWLVVCRELTKVHEEVFRGTVKQSIEHFSEPRGEFTLVIEGYKELEKPRMTEEIEKRLYSMYSSGIAAKKAISMVAEETGISRKELYRIWLRFVKSYEKELLKT